MRRILSSLILVSACLLTAHSQEATVRPYFTTEELPDLIESLPAPPEKGTPAFKYDVKRYKWGKEQRLNPERADMARRDAVWSYEALLTELSVPFGTAISETATPCALEPSGDQSRNDRPDACSPEGILP